MVSGILRGPAVDFFPYHHSIEFHPILKIINDISCNNFEFPNFSMLYFNIYYIPYMRNSAKLKIILVEMLTYELLRQLV